MSLRNKLRFVGLTDTGKVREHNEDTIAVDPDIGLVVLADGMGGYNAGEVASGMCTSFIKTELGRWLAEASESATDTDVRRAMDICVDNANRAIFNAANSNPQYAGMGTTLVVGVFRENRLLLGHVGDSRCYRQRAGRLVQITHDHSLLQEQIDSGLITAEQAAFSSNKNLVTRAVGVEDTVLLETHEISARVTTPVQASRPNLVADLADHCHLSNRTCGLTVAELDESL